jgi:hypothetical protein
MKVGLWDHLAVCVSVYPSIEFWMPELIFMKLGTYIMTPELISREYFIKFLPSFCMSLCMDTFPWQRIHGTVKELLEASFSIRSVSSQRSRSVCLRIPLPLLGKGSVNTFPRQSSIVGGVVSYAVRVVSKESLLLDLTRFSCFFIIITSEAWPLHNRQKTEFRYIENSYKSFNTL